MLKSQGKVIVGLLIFTLAVVATAAAFNRQNPAVAQQADEAFPPLDPVVEMSPWPMGPPPMMDGRFGGGMPMGPMMGQTAIAASGDYVYVVYGGTLHQFSAKTLKIVNKAELAPMPPQRYGPPEGMAPQEMPGQHPGH